MGQVRKPFQGVWNIVRFNWHLYAISVIVVLGLTLLGSLISTVQPYAIILAVLVIGSTLLSLIVSCYVYDLSSLYKLSWLSFVEAAPGSRIINVHAGFDETSALLQGKFCSSEITVLDFYDLGKHTELSIKRARRAYPAFPGTVKVSTTQFPLGDKSADLVFVMLSAHEIRNANERVAFFSEIGRILNPEGRVIVTEHLRDTANFLAYNIGCFHFHSKRSWLTSFRSSGLEIERTVRITPFITTFVLKEYGTSS